MTARFLSLIAAALLVGMSSARADGFVINFHMQQQGTKSLERDYTLTLYPKVVDLKTADTEEIYDFGNLHYYQADFSRHTVVSYPLYAIPVSNQLEKQRRLQDIYAEQRRTNPGLTLADVKDIDVDMMFGSEKDTKTSDMIQTSLADGVTIFRAGNEELTRLASSDVIVPTAYKSSYAHFFLYGLALHPVIDRAAGQSPNVFKTLHFINRDGVSNEEYTLTMTSTKTTGDNGPVLKGMTQVFTGDDKLDASIRNSATPMKTPQQLEDKVSAFLAQKDYLRAALAAKEVQLMLGQQAADSSVVRQALSATDPMTQAMMIAINTPPATTADFIQHLQLFNKAAAQAPDFDYLIELFRADHIRAVLQDRAGMSAQEQQAMGQAFQKLGDAIAANSWLTGAYCDLGDAYFSAHAPKLAWILWEQAERINPRYPALEHVATMQQNALKDFPEYF